MRRGLHVVSNMEMARRNQEKEVEEGERMDDCTSMPTMRSGSRAGKKRGREGAGSARDVTGGSLGAKISGPAALLGAVLLVGVVAEEGDEAKDCEGDEAAKEGTAAGVAGALDEVDSRVEVDSAVLLAVSIDVVDAEGQGVLCGVEGGVEEEAVVHGSVLALLDLSKGVGLSQVHDCLVVDGIVQRAPHLGDVEALVAIVGESAEDINKLSENNLWHQESPREK